MPLFEAIEKGTGTRPYSGKVGEEDSNNLDMAYRVVADHIRTLTVTIADGGRPDNVGRGYVLRRILRRGIRYATEKLNAKPGFFASLVDCVVDSLGEFFPEVSRDPQTIKDVINEEEAQFLKTLTRGKKLLDRTIAKLPEGTKVLPGDLAWRLYDTYGFPVDLTQLMSEERGLEVDLEGYEVAKATAILASQGVSGGAEDRIALDVHAINELQQKGLSPTDDEAKYRYVTDKTDPDAAYKFEACQGKVVGLRHDKKFVDVVESGTECGILLDRTSFYAEQGGQIYDEGFLVKADDESVEFKVTNVQVRAGYVLHVGRIEGTLRVGDVVNAQIDEVRRKNVMNNHTGTHVLNYALRKVLTAEADQKGSLVAPDRMRFDFTANKALTVEQVKSVEVAANELISKNDEVFAKESPLAVAKTIQGLRAVFDETYPDPVRVVSIGIPVDKLESDPTSPAGSKTSVEFCGGTHLRRAGHIGDFVLASEEAIAKGIRRVIALTGPEAAKARQKAKLLENHCEDVKAIVTAGKRPQKELVKLITELNDDISQATIAHWKKDELRTKLKTLKKTLDDADRAKKAAAMTTVVDSAKALLADNPDLPFLVHHFEDAGAQNKVIDAALKQVKALSPNTPAMFFSDSDEKVLCMSVVPKDLVSSKGLKANEWCGAVQALIDGKGGGKPENAQASGSKVAGMKEAMAKAEQFVMEKLGVDKKPEIKAPSK